MIKQLFLATCIYLTQSLSALASPTQIIQFVSKKSDKGIGLRAGVTRPGSGLILTPNVGKEQSWIVQEGPGGTKIFINQVSGIAMGCRDPQNGAVVRSFHAPYHSSENWILQPAGDGYYFIENAQSHKVLGILGDSGATGMDLIQWSLDRKDNQKWKLDPVK